MIRNIAIYLLIAGIFYVSAQGTARINSTTSIARISQTPTSVSIDEILLTMAPTLIDENKGSESSESVISSILDDEISEEQGRSGLGTILIIALVGAFLSSLVVTFAIIEFFVRRAKDKEKERKERKRHRSKHKKSPQEGWDDSVAASSKNASETTATDSSHLGISNMGMTSVVTGTMGEASKTLVPTESGLAIPAYLRIAYPNDFRLGPILTKGGGAEIYIAELVSPTLRFLLGNVAIAKKLPYNQKKEVDAFYQEVSILNYLKQNDNICKLAGYCENPSVILLKYYENGSLYQFLQNSDLLHSKAIHVGFARDIAAGIAAVHRAGIAHCDLKPQNVLIDFDIQSKRYFCVIADFGSSQVFQSEILKVQAFNPAPIRGWTKPFAAPEILQANTKPFVDYYKGACDIYSYGLILYHLFTMVYPWSSFENK